MYNLKIGKKEYAIKYTHSVLGETDILDRVINITNGEGQSPSSLIKLLAELLLAGLQKNHGKDFGYLTDGEKKEKLNKVYDLLDEYCESGDEENPNTTYDLFVALQEELGNNGFLKGLLK